MFGDYIIYMVLTGIVSLVGMFVSNRLKRKFQQYSQIGIASGLNGKEVAERMLEYYGISDVKVVPARGFLTDHYNPLNKTVNLSENVYNSSSVAAAAVAAHECGHAVQHAEAYAPLKMRSAIVPIVKISSGAQQILLLVILGMFGTQISNNPTILLIALIAFGVTLLFSLITLPVEFDASNRALVWLNGANVTSSKEHDGAKDALKWAAMTYVAAAASALVGFLFVLLKYMAASRN